MPLEAKLERARTELLDLSARNRLLNIPRSGKSAKIVEIVDEQSREIFRLLVRDQRALTFLPGKAARDSELSGDDEQLIAELAQPDDDGVDARGVANRHANVRGLTPDEGICAQALARMCSGTGDARALRRSMRRVVDADGEVDPGEVAFVAEIEGRLRASGRL